MKTFIILFISLCSVSGFAINNHKNPIFDDKSSNSCNENTTKFVYKNYLKFIDPTNKLDETQSITTILYSNSAKIANGKYSYFSIDCSTKDSKKLEVIEVDNLISTKIVFDGSEVNYTTNGIKTGLPQHINEYYKYDTKFIFPEQNQFTEKSMQIKKYNNREVYSIFHTYTIDNFQIQTESYFDKDDFRKIVTIEKKMMGQIVSETSYFYNNYKPYGDFILPETVIINTKSQYEKQSIEVLASADYIFNRSVSDFNNEYTIKNLKKRYIDKIKNNVEYVQSQNLDISSSWVNNSNSSQQTNSNSTYTNIASVTQNAQGNNKTTQNKSSSLSNNSTYSLPSNFEYLNKREQAYQLMLASNQSVGNTKGYNTNSYSSVESSGHSERINRMDAANAGKLKYRRSSLYTMMLDDNTREHYDVIKDAFGNAELSEKFNNHNVGPYLIEAHGESGEKDQSYLIEDYLNRNQVAKDLVSKWFNRDSEGKFNMNLVASRGQYNASEIDVKIAQNSIRGKALLSDMGKELINNTFVIVYDYKYTNKEESAKKRRGWLNAISSVASYVPGAENVTTIASVATLGSEVVGKGYYVKTTSYLYRLVWNDDIASQFFQTMWIDAENYDSYKKQVFENSNLFRLEYVGNEVSRNNLQSTIFTSKSNSQLIEIATTNAVDKNIGKLQRTYEQFRVKTPLLSINPITAQIGLKEGLEKKDQFEVLEQNLAEDGSTYYKRVGIIRVDNRQIWDNTYTAQQSGTYSQQPYTVFKGNSKKFAPGMLIRQIK